MISLWCAENRRGSPLQRLLSLRSLCGVTGIVECPLTIEIRSLYWSFLVEKLFFHLFSCRSVKWGTSPSTGPFELCARLVPGYEKCRCLALTPSRGYSGSSAAPTIPTRRWRGLASLWCRKAWRVSWRFFHSSCREMSVLHGTVDTGMDSFCVSKMFFGNVRAYLKSKK